MEEARFEIRLRCAVAAGWWTVLIGAVWLTLSWLIWQWILVCPGCANVVEWLWGGIKMADVKPLLFAFFGVFKLILFACVLVSIFLTIWLRKLRKAA